MAIPSGQVGPKCAAKHKRERKQTTNRSYSPIGGGGIRAGAGGRASRWRAGGRIEAVIADDEAIKAEIIKDKGEGR